jgi:hypothetical protein
MGRQPPDDRVVEEGLTPVLIGPDEAEQYVAEQQEIYQELVPLVQELSGDG